MSVRSLARLLLVALVGLALVGAIPSLVLWVKRVAAKHAREDLVASLGPCRPIEGRLSVGLTYAPYGETIGGWRIGRGQWKTIQHLQQLSTPEIPLPPQYAALIKVFGGSFSDAMSTYEATPLRESRNGEILSDLAAISMAEPMSADPKHNLRALHLARRAVVLAPEYFPARFNLALAFEKNFLYQKAIAAWRDYLVRDPSSSWGREARNRLDNLSRPSLREAWLGKADEVESLLLRADIRGLSQIVMTFPEFAKNYAEDTILHSWAEYWLKGDLGRAEEQLSKADLLGKALSEYPGESMVIDVVDVIHGQGVSPKAAHRLSSLAQGQILFMAGRDFCLRGESLKGRKVLERSRNLLAGADSPLRLWADVFVAICAYKNSDYSEALRRLNKILDSEKEIRVRYPSLEAKIYWLNGLCYISSGEPSRALESYQEARAVYSRLNFTESLGAVSYLLSENLRFLGESPEAWQELYQGLALTVRVGDPWRMYTAFNDTAEAASLVGYHQEALDFWDEVVRIAQLTPDPPSLAHAFLKRGETQFLLGNVRAALKDLEEAQHFCGEIDDPAARRRAEADILLVSGKAEIKSNPVHSVIALGQALHLYRQDDYVIYDVDAYQAKAKALIALGEFQNAETTLLAGIEEVESTRRRVTDERLRMLYLEAVRDLFDQMIRLQIRKTNGESKSLVYAEQSRARVLFEQVRTSRQADTSFEFSSGPIRALDIDALIQSMPSRIVFLEYAVLEDRLLIWTLHRDKKVALSQVFVSSREIEAQVTRLEHELVRDKEEAGPDSAAAWLYDRLILPVRANLKKGDLLVVSADKALQRVPLALLWDKQVGRFLVEDHAVSNVPSCALLQASIQMVDGAQKRRSKILVIGNPMISRVSHPSLSNLSGAEIEARKIADFYGEDAVLVSGTNATGERLLRDAGNYEVLHLAAHAVGNPSFPDLAHVILAPSTGREDGAVYVRELRAFRPKRTQLVVLATCGAISDGTEGTEVQVILARAFLAAGVPSVVGSRWEIGDRTASALYLELHRRIKKGQSPAEALRGAQLTMLYSFDQKRRAANAWAGFEVFGGLTPITTSISTKQSGSGITEY